MKKIAVIGAGNVGIAAAEAILESPDMELCGFIRRKAKAVPGFEEIPAEERIFALPEKPDGALICLPSGLVEPVEKELLEAGIYTADCFDIHEELPGMKKKLLPFAKKGSAAAVIGAGWDPGLDSVIRALMLAAFPSGKGFTDFGPGMSMGHSAAARSREGVLDAVAFTYPLGEGKHRRKVCVVLKKDSDPKEVEHAILSDGYFEHGQCSVEFVPSVKPFFKSRHRVHIGRKSGDMSADFFMDIDNPKVTARMAAASLRAAFLQEPGVYFLSEIPPEKLIPEGEDFL